MIRPVVRFVLLVEDDADMRLDLAYLIERRGYPVITAANGADALVKLLQGEAPGLIVLDLMMPVMDGWTLYSELSKRPALANVPVVVLSGAADVDEETATLGAVTCLTKPVDLPKLYDLVARYC